MIGTSVSFADAKLTLDGNAFEGSLAVNTDGGHASISGTLATDLLDLEPIADTLPPPDRQRRAVEPRALRRAGPGA